MKKLITAIVLAAGKSSRMNEYKLTKLLLGKPVIKYVFDTLESCDFHEVIVVYERDEVSSLADSYGFKTVKNNHSHLGQSTSIALGTENADKCDGFIYIIADQPFLGKDTLDSMMKIFSENPSYFVAPSVDGKRCSPVIFPYEYRDELMALKGDIGGRPILKANSDKILLCECQDIEALDLDTNEDFYKAEDYLRSRG